MQKENSEDSSSDLSENEFYVEKILDKKIVFNHLDNFVDNMILKLQKIKALTP